MIYKNSEVHFDVNSQIKRSISANIQFSTQDIDTAKLTFSLTKDGVPLPISQATHGKLFMRFADGSKFYVNTEVHDALGGAIFYVLTPEQVKHYGTVQAELYVNYDNGQKLSVHKFSFEIDRALVDQGIAPVAEYYIDDFESLKAAVQEMADDAERVIAELQKKFENLDNIETKEGAQEKADAAEAGAKAYADEHAAKIDNPHKVTKAQVGLSNVDNVKQASKSEFDTHNNDTTRHITADERTKWNAGQLYKLTDDNGGRTQIPDGTDLLTLPSGLYYAVSNKIINSPDPNVVEWFHYDVSTNNTRKTIIVTATANPKRWFGTIHTDGSFKGWQRFITEDDFLKKTFVDTYDFDNSAFTATEGVVTKIKFGTARADDQSEYDQTKSEITLKNSGLYLVRLYISATSIPANSDISLICYVNDAQYQTISYWYPTRTAQTYVSFLQQKFSSGDKVTFHIFPKITGSTPSSVSVKNAFLTMSQIR
ncbi:phage baseplate upper protein [Bacillus licheniformis]|uniref:phage baseplate upper protein n=1 Tax=Bacillus licheniformis TaxID=1402 RepID=UPI002DB9A95A|nr:BppU family phage baseplate upper protein [Bacillus licheniformis]MEC1349183.1 BppU family phage baseplate upper protein [Bacillus licheniformis]